MKKSHYDYYLMIVFIGILSLSAENSFAKDKFGVYEYVIRSAEGGFEEISDSLLSGIESSDWELLATVNAGVPNDCGYQARVFILYDSSFVSSIMNANRLTGAYSAVDRVILFEDENGIHLSLVNHQSIDRTVLLDDESFDDNSKNQHEKLRELITANVNGSVSTKQYGQMRKKGFIGRTMGVMAGGDFDGKVNAVTEVEGGNLEDVAAKVRSGLGNKGKKWGIHLAFELNLPEFDTVIFGVTGTPMDSKSFDIVGAGGDDSRDGFKCAGIAHAGAYPLEVVAQTNDEGVSVSSVEAMYRMKVYFEDAGKWAFMKNMTMPGSIGSEISDLLENVTDED